MKNLILFVLTTITLANLNAQEINFDEYKAMPLPEYSEPKNPLHLNKRISFDAESNQELIANLESFGITQPVPEQGHSIVSNEKVGKQTKDFSNLDRITRSRSHKYPFGTATKLFITLKSGQRVVCSGTMVNPRAVLTCGHCIFSHDAGGWAKEVSVIPGFNDDGGFKPYGQAKMVNMITFTGWTQNEDWEWDAAMVILDRPIGSLTGWLGFGYNNNGNHFVNNTFHTTGYPATAPFDGGEQYYRHGTFDFIQGDNLVYSYDKSYGGQSGSGTYHKNQNGDRFVQALLSHGNGFTTGQVRLTPGKVSTLWQYVLDKTPSGNDLIPLRVSSDKDYYRAGEEIKELNIYCHNDSKNSFSGKVNVDYYLSTDPYISTSDTKIGQAGFSVASINERRSVHLVNASPAIPRSIRPGRYYLGAIISNNDANRSNNMTGYWDVKVINISQATTTSTDELARKINLEVFPNPTIETATVQFNVQDPKDVSIDLFNMLGERIRSIFQGSNFSGPANIQVMDRQISRGSYILNIQIDQEVIQKKLIKN